MSHIVFFDLETGGLERDAPNIQLAAVAVEVPSWREVGSIEMKLHFDESTANPEALAMNSYDRAVWRERGVDPFSAYTRFDRWLRNYLSVPMTSKAGKPYRVARLAGHNAAAFDMPRLVDAFKHYQLFLPAAFQVLDTLQLALWQGLGTRFESHRLSDLCEALGIDAAGAHDALADVRMSAAVARALLQEDRP